MLMLEVKDMGWWYWLVTAALLSYGTGWEPMGFYLAIALTVFQLIHYIILKRDVTAFPVQVRFYYLLLLLLALPEAMRWLYWIPTIGTWAQVVFGYCAMARLVSLYPWNRQQPLTAKLITTTFFSLPVKGSVNAHNENNKAELAE